MDCSAGWEGLQSSEDCWATQDHTLLRLLAPIRVEFGIAGTDAKIWRFVAGLSIVLPLADFAGPAD
ncbi:MAG: hypothetical protein MI755_18350 [Sphingomonadales bacterium]|nr:hypothetical protein [Sphingomonadales bacterium]